MKNFCRITISLLILSLVLPSCESKSAREQTSKTTVFAENVMTIDYRIIIGAPLNENQSKQVETIIAQTFNEANQVYNRWNPESELSKLNRMNAGVHTTISPVLEKLLLITDQIFNLTEGRFDPTIEPLQQLWKNNLEKGNIPSDSQIALIAPSIGWKNIHFDNGTFWKDHDMTSLDLGGIAKGFCVDELVERLNAAGYESVFVEWGGEIRASGQHPDSRPWQIFISRLGDVNPDNAFALVELKNNAIATSGDYYQFWEIGGKRYFHIIDPKTFRPLEIHPDSIAGASILANTCAIADGLATSAMMFATIPEAEAWLERVKGTYPEIKAWLLTNESAR